MNENDKTVRESRFPEVWADWETVEELGKGSYGAVYKIRRNLGSYTEYAAVKRISIPNDPAEIRALRQNGYDDESITESYREQSEKFIQEYALMRSLNGNTNIVNCDDVKKVSHADGIGADVYIKMELLTPLGEMVSGALSEETVIRIGTDLCQALELCEKNGIIHRDIKPANIFVSKNGDYKLGDFGVSRIMENTTTDGTVTGTPRYMAPEVYGSRGYNRTADIYSLGLVLYWLLNERRTPFQPLPPAKLSFSADQEALNRRMKGEEILAPKNGSEALKKIVLKACAYDPKARYQSATELKRALMHMESSEPELIEGTVSVRKTETTSEPIQGTVSVRKAEATSETKQPSGKKPWALLLLLLLIPGAIFLMGGRDKPAAEKEPVIETPAPTAAPTAKPAPSAYTPFTYESGDSGITITGYKGEVPAELILPEKIDGKKVTAIGMYAFKNNDFLTSVTISKNVTSIDAEAFRYCDNLSSITIPDGVMSIGNNTFEGCSSLESVTIPNSLTSIGYEAFSGCQRLMSITLPETLTNIDDYAFSGCNYLTDITIPKNVTKIGYGAFGSCDSLTRVTISDGVASIGGNAFSFCKNLRSITIPKSVISIGDRAFSYCNNLTSITIPANCKVGTDAFPENCKVTRK